MGSRDKRLSIGGDAPIGMTLQEFEEMQRQHDAMRQTADAEDADDDGDSDFVIDEGQSQADEEEGERGTMVSDGGQGSSHETAAVVAAPEPTATKEGAHPAHRLLTPRSHPVHAVTARFPAAQSPPLSLLR